MLAKINKNKKVEFGDVVEISGRYEIATSYKNEGTFNFKNYLKTKQIYGILEVKTVKKVDENSYIKKFFYNINTNIQKKLKNNFDKDSSSVLIALLLGNKSSLDSKIKNSFIDSGISHILAISGMHVACIIMIIQKLIDNIFIDMKKKKIATIVILVLYLLIIGFIVSAVRAIIMAVLSIIAKLIYRKSNNWINLSIASLIILICNPYYILDSGFILSFGATVGILCIYPYFNKISIKNKIVKYFIDIILIGISVNIFIFPILVFFFKKISFTTFISTILMTPLVFVIEVMALISVIIPNRILQIISPIIEFIIKIFLAISKLNIGNINIKVLSKPETCIYYGLILYIFYKFQDKRIITIIKKVNILLIIVVLVINLVIPRFDRKLTIYFIDVGQGDSCLIKTEENKKILIDGGGSDSYDVGKNVLIPYLLNKKIDKLDYLIISHFDSDHVAGLFTVIEEIKVKKVIIGKQFQTSKNYEKFIRRINEKQIEVIKVEAGQRINIENNLYFDVLWPSSEYQIKENLLNNNSLVCKLIYKDCSILFTGDIEEEAEKEILEKYKNNLDILNSDILKIPHHGSKTSSTINFLKVVKPKSALIGVGENNKFGHPNDDVIERLEDLRSRNL